MAFAPSASRNSRFIIHLASCRNRCLPTDCTDGPPFPTLTKEISFTTIANGFAQLCPKPLPPPFFPILKFRATCNLPRTRTITGLAPARRAAFISLNVAFIPSIGGGSGKCPRKASKVPWKIGTISHLVSGDRRSGERAAIVVPWYPVSQAPSIQTSLSVGPPRCETSEQTSTGSCWLNSKNSTGVYTIMADGTHLACTVAADPWRSSRCAGGKWARRR